MDPRGVVGHVLPQRQGPDRFALKYAHEYLSTPLPTPTYPIDITSGLTAWGGFGNSGEMPPQYPNPVGDCVDAAKYHLYMSTALGAGQPLPALTTLQCITDYFAQTGGKDTGVRISDSLLWSYNRGDILAFAPVDYTNLAVRDGLCQAGWGIILGMWLPTANNGQGGGHCVVLAKVVAQGGDEFFITWGDVESFKDETYLYTIDEAWLVVTHEEQLAAFEPALLADITALGGTGGPPPPPPVYPTPIAGETVLIQTVGTPFGGTPTAVQQAINVQNTGATLLAFVCGSTATSPMASSVSGAGATWTRRGSRFDHPGTVEVWEGTGAAAGVQTVTASLVGPIANCAFIVQEWTGTGSTAPDSVTYGSSSAPPSVIVSPQAGDGVSAFIFCGNGIINVAAPFTGEITLPMVNVSSCVAPVTGALAAAWVTGGGAWNGLAIALPAGSAPPPPPPSPLPPPSPTSFLDHIKSELQALDATLQAIIAEITAQDAATFGGSSYGGGATG